MDHPYDDQGLPHPEKVVADIKKMSDYLKLGDYINMECDLKSSFDYEVYIFSYHFFYPEFTLSVYEHDDKGIVYDIEVGEEETQITDNEKSLSDAIFKLFIAVHRDRFENKLQADAMHEQYVEDKKREDAEFMDKVFAQLDAGKITISEAQHRIKERLGNNLLHYFNERA